MAGAVFEFLHQIIVAFFEKHVLRIRQLFIDFFNLKMTTIIYLHFCFPEKCFEFVLVYHFIISCLLTNFIFDII